MELKKPLSYDEQISALKGHNWIIDGEDFVKETLHRVSYYRLSGYALQYRVDTNNSNLIEGVTFDDVLKIYSFDEELRWLLHKYIEILEVYSKTQIAYEFSRAKCKCPPYNQHYNEANYYNKDGFLEIKENFAKYRKYYSDTPIMKHHLQKYNGQFPLWVILEMLSFSDVSKLYNCMYFSEKEAIARRFNLTKETLSNNLKCMSVLRNKCAHAARLYNTTFNPPAKLPKSFLIANKEVSNDSLFAYIVVLIKLLPNDKYKKDLIREMDVLFGRYERSIDLLRIGFPSNWKVIIENKANDT